MISHVLEHFEKPFEILEKIILSSRKLGITRLVIIVPGESGYKLDKTHRYFVRKHELVNFFNNKEGARIIGAKLFPFNFDFVSKLFAYNELQVVVEF